MSPAAALPQHYYAHYCFDSALRYDRHIWSGHGCYTTTHRMRWIYARPWRLNLCVLCEAPRSTVQRRTRPHAHVGPQTFSCVLDP